MNPSYGSWSFCTQWCRRLEVTLSRLRIGHTRLAHGHLMARETPPVCRCCQVRLSVFNDLVECPAYSVPRSRFFPSLTSMPPCERLSLLSESPNFSSTLFTFLRVSGLIFNTRLSCSAACWRDTPPNNNNIVLWPSLQLKGHKGKIFCFSSLS